jgi:RES domain
VILYRCFAWNERARATDPDGALWFPRPFQGEGRHDNPDHYGCLYVADRALSCVVEQLARFRGQPLAAALLRRRTLPLALAELELADTALLLDLDNPAVLRRERLRPSLIATRQRTITQPQARALHDTHAEVAGLRWWSTFEALWMNVTLFERARDSLRTVSVEPLSLEHPTVGEAAQLLGLV